VGLISVERDAFDAEVIVIGSGPGGAATAIHLARRGRRVLLLEGRDLARDRPADMRSGEVLSPGGQRELAALGLPCDGADWRLTPFDVVRNHWHNGRVTHDRLPRGLAYWQIDRGRLDRALFALARAEGVDARDACRAGDLLRDETGSVRGVVIKPGPTTNQKTWRAPVVVDASGRRSVILARLGLQEPEPAVRRLALVLFFADVPGCAPGVWEQHFFAAHNTTLRGSMMRPALYRYSFETDLAYRDRFTLRHGKLTPRAMALAMLAELRPALHERFTAASALPYTVAYAPVGYRVREITHDGLVMVGDAAGYLDPSSGQGIEFALRTARLAAASIDGALATGDYRAAAFAPYLDGRRRELDAAMRALRLYLCLSRQKPLLSLFSRLQPARSLMTRSLVTPRCTSV